MLVAGIELFDTIRTRFSSRKSYRDLGLLTLGSFKWSTHGSNLRGALNGFFPQVCPGIDRENNITERCCFNLPYSVGRATKFIATLLRPQRTTNSIDGIRSAIPCMALISEATILKHLKQGTLKYQYLQDLNKTVSEKIRPFYQNIPVEMMFRNPEQIIPYEAIILGEARKDHQRRHRNVRLFDYDMACMDLRKEFPGIPIIRFEGTNDMAATLQSNLNGSTGELSFTAATYYITRIITEQMNDTRWALAKDADIHNISIDADWLYNPDIAQLAALPKSEFFVGLQIEQNINQAVYSKKSLLNCCLSSIKVKQFILENPAIFNSVESDK